MKIYSTSKSNVENLNPLTHNVVSNNYRFCDVNKQIQVQYFIVHVKQGSTCYRGNATQNLLYLEITPAFVD